MQVVSRISCTIAFILYGTLFLFAEPPAHSEPVEEIIYDKWNPWLDMEENLVFIDFEALDFNLLEIKVYDEDNELVFSDRVDDLPFNSIYELDVTTFDRDSYTINLHSFSSVFPADLHLKR
ncbi:MAG: hypothetical protein EA411_07320 [Saprospirales bacterium]|nr:MAG: hypothetical protein EA411_07320 [Saprospirales bacterium]